jgi:hypothetical protein
VRRTTLAALVTERVLDSELAALAWLLVEDEVPLVVTGSASLAERTAVASALSSIDPGHPFVVIDADDEAPTLARLSASLRGGLIVGLVLEGRDLQSVFDRLRAAPASLPDDAIRRLGLVLVVDETVRGTRVTAAHYLRPTERDGQGHLQRRPPAVLATWDESTDGFEHFAWGIVPELADRIDRSPADLEQRQLDRAGFLATMARTAPVTTDDWPTIVRRYLATEATRTPSPRPTGR